MNRRKPLPLVGTIFVWLGALIWCFELLVGAWPSGLYFLLIPVGLILTIVATIRHSDWRPFAFTIAAAILPVIALAMRALEFERDCFTDQKKTQQNKATHDSRRAHPTC